VRTEFGSRYQEPRQVGRYAIYGVIGAGGMATVHFGRLLGPAGFARPVAIKRLHEQFASDQAFADMLIEEAHTASRIAHTNVVPTLDVIAESGELWLVMEYVNGESLARLLDVTRGPLPVPIAAALLAGVLHGLHAAHETHSESGELLGIVHRDVSPDNVLVGVDGVPRLADFGVAKARGRVRTTPAGKVKGKLAYMPVEQIRGLEVDRRADVYSAGAVLWEALTGRLLFDGASEGELIQRVLDAEVVPPSEHNAKVPAALDAIARRALARDREARFATAREMASAIEGALRVASQSEVADWLQQVAGPGLAQRAAQLRTMVETPSLPEGPSTRVATPQRAQSSATRTREQPVSRPSRAHSRWIAPLLTVLLAALAAGYWWLRSEPPPIAAPVLEAVPGPEPEVAPEPSRPALPAPDQVIAPTQLPTTKERRRRARPSASGKPPEVDCSPPYYLDADGIRHVKPQCL
jgi:serine/threonine protein kinase